MTKHHYPRSSAVGRDRNREIKRVSAMPSLDDLAYSVCPDCGDQVGEAYRGRIRSCQHCGQLIGPSADPSPEQIAEAGRRLREHSQWLMANRSRPAVAAAETADDDEEDEEITHPLTGAIA